LDFNCLHGLIEKLPVADEIMVAIEQSVNRFFVQALQLDAFTMELEALGA